MIKKIISFFSNQQKNKFNDFDKRKREQILQRVNELIGSYPNSPNYYIKAFTHRSFLEKTEQKIKSNERLEFLGDAVLGKVTAEYLFNKFPDEHEGFLTKSRSQMVNKHSLEEISLKLGLDKLLFLNEKYLVLNKMKLGNIIADSLEAFIGAIYLDKGDKTVKNFIIQHVIKPQVWNGGLDNDPNFKGQLLEFSHAHKIEQPVYTVIEQFGPQHEKTYKIKVTVGDNIICNGTGPNKKTAEQEAAKKALSILKEKFK